MTTTSESVDQPDFSVGGSAAPIDSLDYGSDMAGEDASVEEAPVLATRDESYDQSLIDGLYDSSLQREAILNRAFANVYYRDGYEPQEVRDLLILVANGVEALTLSHEYEEGSTIPDLDNLAVTPESVRERFSKMSTVLFRNAYDAEEVAAYIQEITEQLEARISALALRIKEIAALQEQQRIEQIATYQEATKRAAREEAAAQAAAVAAQEEADLAARITEEISSVWEEAEEANKAWDAEEIARKEVVATEAAAAAVASAEAAAVEAARASEEAEEAEAAAHADAPEVDAIAESENVIEEIPEVSVEDHEDVWEGEGGAVKPIIITTVADESPVEATEDYNETSEAPQFVTMSTSSLADCVRTLSERESKMSRVFVGSDASGFIPVSSVETDSDSEVLIIQSLSSDAISLLEFSSALKYVQASRDDISDYVVVFKSDVGLHPIDRCDFVNGHVIIYVQ
jgi:hypothetical protein